MCWDPMACANDSFGFFALNLTKKEITGKKNIKNGMIQKKNKNSKKDLSFKNEDVIIPST